MPLSRFLETAVAIGLMMASSPARAGGASEKPVGWEAFNAFTVKASRPDSLDQITWRGVASFESKDIRLDVEQSVGGKKESGTMLLVGGEVLLSRGLHLPEGEEIDALDAPVLTLRLVTSALGIALPEGPGRVQGAVKLSHVERTKPIRVGTASASGAIPVPWCLSGTVSQAAGGSIDFDLQLSPGDALAAAAGPALRYSGTLAKTSRPPLDEAMVLAGWQVFSLGPRQQKRGGSTILDYGASAKSAQAETVATLRAQVAAERRAELDPGKNDPARDFSGFWKEKCEENFGLRFQRGSKSETYSVVFCGPGGCGDPSEGRKTFVTGDAHYQVVGPDEIRERRGDDWRTLKRCAPASAAGKK